MPLPTIGQPLPRAADAYTTGEKWQHWILAAHGHGPQWARVFATTVRDRERLWTAILTAVLDAPVTTVRDHGPNGVVCGVDMVLTINDRTARVATAWHYADHDAAPRLVTAYPTP